MCWARSFFSRMIEPQLATRATHPMRIFTGSALLAAVAPKRPSAHTLAKAPSLMPRLASFRMFIVSSQFRGACADGRLHVERRIVGRPTVFGKPYDATLCPVSGTGRGVCYNPSVVV